VKKNVLSLFDQTPRETQTSLAQQLPSSAAAWCEWNPSVAQA